MKSKDKQEVGYDLNICKLNLLSKVSTLSSIVAISLEKMEMQIYKIVTWLHIGHVIKGSCGFKGRSFLR